jgi:hypothetical protein
MRKGGFDLFDFYFNVKELIKMSIVFELNKIVIELN